jgi:hypothetical protein
MEINTLSDPARFAQAIRDLARSAHCTLMHSPSPAALRRLSRRIERLSSAVVDRSEEPLPIATWLDNLGREVRVAAGRRARSRCSASARLLCVASSASACDY